MHVNMRYQLCFVLFNLCTIALAQIKPVPVYEELLSQFPNVRDFTIANNETEAYFTALSPSGELSFIIRIDKRGKKWSSKIASFSGRNTDLEPFLSPDGLRLYFASNRPLNNGGKKTDFDIWYVEREDSQSPWSSPINVGPEVNTSDSEFYPAITNSGNLYFTCAKTDSESKDDIYISKWTGTNYETPVSLGSGVNSNGYEFNAYIAPDESFIVFSGFGRPDGLGQGDLYMSKKDEQGNWKKAENLGKNVNSNKLDYCPFVNTKTGVLYFTSKRSNVTLKKDGFNSTKEFLKEINKYENGLSRIYRVSIQK